MAALVDGGLGTWFVNSLLLRFGAEHQMQVTSWLPRHPTGQVDFIFGYRFVCYAAPTNRLGVFDYNDNLDRVNRPELGEIPKVE